MSIQGQLTAFTMMGATWVLWTLVVLSVIVVAVVLDRLVFFLLTRDKESLRRQLTTLVAQRQTGKLARLLAGQRGHRARVLTAALDAPTPDAARERIETELDRTRAQSAKRLSILATIGSNAPFIGLLGTVIGIIRSFHLLDSSNGQVTTALMSEVGEALVATALGMLVAIPALIAFNVFQRLARARLDAMQTLARDLVTAHDWPTSGR